MAKTLSETAKLYLLLIDEQTVSQDGRTLERYWIPGTRWESVTIRATGDHIIMGGGGAAKILTSLEAAGLIGQTPAMRRVHPYAYRSTEKGRIVIQEWDEWIDRRKRCNARELEKRLATQEAD